MVERPTDGDKRKAKSGNLEDDLKDERSVGVV
jgi:hypothetical protein